MADATSLTPPSPGLGATLLSNKRVERYRPGLTLQQPHPRFYYGSYTHRSNSAPMMDLYQSVNQNCEHINQDSTLRWNKTSTQQQTNSETLEQQKSNSWTPGGPIRDRVCCFVKDTPVISRCRSQHVSVEYSSLLHHSIYLWFICFTWWSIDELENLHADRTTVCFEPW